MHVRRIPGEIVCAVVFLGWLGLFPVTGRAQSVAIYVSSAAGDRLTRKKDGQFLRQEDSTKNRVKNDVSRLDNDVPRDKTVDILVDEDLRYQEMAGFGATFNEAGMICLNSLGPKDRDKVLKSLFDTVSGAGFTLMKLPMAACDFASAGPWYSYDDTPGDTALLDFSIRRDLGPDGQVNYVRNAARFGRFQIETTMDFPPDWMMYGLKDGEKHVRPGYYGVLARYYSRYLQAYAEQGIGIGYLNPLNEAENNWFSNISYKEIGEMVKGYIAPQLRADGVNTKIQLCETASRPEGIRKLPAAMDDPAVSKEVHTLTVHGYDWSSFQTLTELHRKYPGIPIWMTEICYALPNNVPPGGPTKLPLYEFEDGAFWGNMILNDLKNEVSGWIYWNMILDQDGGPWLVSPVHGDPAQNHQQPVVIVDRSSHRVSYTGLYYYLAHFSRFIRPGARRIDCSASGDSPELNFAGFSNPDGSHVLNIVNTGSGRTCRLRWKNRILFQDIPARSIVTLRW
ncbi:MAG: glycoside hydrolase family 30 protein [Puia sp.]|nr:glycoside hydrolase family 30 protein [Puia sp.]